MKKLLLSFTIFLSFSSFAQWENPAVLCPEKILPQGHECPDLSRVKNPFTDFPSYMSSSEIKMWKMERSKDLKLCRYTEALEREEKHPGTLTKIQKQIAWMIVEGGKNSQEKLEAVLKATSKYHMPPHILLGALTQESLMASLGISPDGGNYSCGIAQLNIQEWCEGASRLSYAEKQKMNWPDIECRHLPSDIISGFYQIAERKLGDRPDYMINAKDFEGISFGDVASTFPSGEAEVQRQRFQAATSFLKFCQNDDYSIQFKALNLNQLFVKYVPDALKFQSVYKEGARNTSQCRDSYNSRYYPLHTGWLLAVASYNAGPRQVELVEHYFQVKNNKFPTLTPKDLIEALYWGGKIKESNKKTYFVGQRGRLASQPWYKSCVVQRHVARVIEHVTVPGVTLASSLEKEACSQKSIPADRLKFVGIK